MLQKYENGDLESLEWSMKVRIVTAQVLPSNLSLARVLTNQVVWRTSSKLERRLGHWTDHIQHVLIFDPQVFNLFGIIFVIFTNYDGSMYNGKSSFFNYGIGLELGFNRLNVLCLDISRPNCTCLLISCSYIGTIVTWVIHANVIPFITSLSNMDSTWLSMLSLSPFYIYVCVNYLSSFNIFITKINHQIKIK